MWDHSHSQTDKVTSSIQGILIGQYFHIVVTPCQLSYAIKNVVASMQEIPLIRGFGYLELYLYGIIRKLAYENIENI